jgi:hypothetical protein
LSPTVEFVTQGNLVSPEADLRGFVLTLGDLPDGFSVARDETGVVSNGDWVSGYRVMYRATSIERLMDTAFVGNTMAVDKDEPAAQARFGRSLADADDNADRVSVPPLGDESAAWVFHSEDDEIGGMGYAIAFRIGNLVSHVVTAGISPSLEETLRLAQLVVDRINTGGQPIDSSLPSQAQDMALPSPTSTPLPVPTPVYALRNAPQPEIAAASVVFEALSIVEDDFLFQPTDYVIGVIRNISSQDFRDVEAGVVLYSGGVIVFEKTESSEPYVSVLGPGEWATFELRIGEVEEWDAWRLYLTPGWYATRREFDDLQITSHSYSLGAIRGEVRNTGANAFSQIYIAVAGYDSEGNLVAVGNASTEAKALRPGEATAFRVSRATEWTGNPSLIARYDIRVVGAID